MKKISIAWVAVLIFGLVNVASAAENGSVSSTIQTFKSFPAVAKFFNSAYGYAVFPTIGKAGFVIGGSYGVGEVYRGGQATGRAKVFAGSVGFQLGGKAFSEIIFFQDKRAYDEFTSGNFEFDATAQAIAITAGVEAKASTAGASAGASAGPRSGVQAETNYMKGMATFIHGKGGLMFEFSIGGQKFFFEPYR
ncbi:MAG: lipid-binding SYLF domain-containing protein [Deltaproteobacteria bacterium]|nr:lipid-binding SYLF domain-containing protein [Deltaproteobacteria bacterium]